jgi:Phosphotransferase enzyme family
LATVDQDEREAYHVITLSGTGHEVLVVEDNDRFKLPSVVIPRWQRVAENLTGTMKSEWGEEVICLFERDWSSEGKLDGGFHYQVAEHWRHCGAPRTPTQWASSAELSQNSFHDPSDCSAIENVIAECRAETLGPGYSPFARPGWFKELWQWIETVIGPTGSHLTGNFRQFNASPSFSLIRFETDGLALWFKAVGQPNQREFPITRTLAKLFPNYLPPILAIRPEWNGWLAQGINETNLGETQEALCWERAAEALAELQIASVKHHSRILEAGARDLSVTALSDRVEPFMEIMSQLMERQVKSPPAILSRNDLCLMGEQIQTALGELTALGIPQALGHLDLNPGNIVLPRAASPSRCAFLDWSEAYVGNPFFSFEYLLEHFRRTVGTDPKVERRLTETYVTTWEPFLSSEVIDQSLAVAPLLAAFAYAAGTDVWEDAERLEDPATAGFLRSLTRRMNREANELADRRRLCMR